VLGYKQLKDVEQAFRTLKTTLELRPNYYSKDERVRCHSFLCFLALVLARIAELKTGISWTSIRQEMSRLLMGQFIVDQKKVSQLTELTQQQQLILKQLASKEQASIVEIQSAWFCSNMASSGKEGLYRCLIGSNPWFFALQL